MSIVRSLRLLAIHNKQFFLKLRYDLGRELVVLISSAVLLGLFAYIFRDFLNDKLRSIPAPEQAAIARTFAAIILVLTGHILAAPIFRLWREQPNLSSFARRIGENPQTVMGFLVLQTLLLIGCGYAIYWTTVGLPWGKWTPLQQFAWQSASLLTGLLRFALHRQKAQDTVFKPLLDDRPTSRIQTLITWRWKQILWRNRLAKLCLALAVLIQLGSGVLLGFGAPFALAVLLGMASGLLVACAPSFQLQEDMRVIWFDRQVACSHEEYVALYQNICIRLAVGSGVAAVMIALLGRGVGLPLETLKLLPITALFPLLFPAVMFQIAPERPFLQIMSIAMIGLFLGTAIFAHWAAVAIVPIALMYAKQYQQNNFYRS